MATLTAASLLGKGSRLAKMVDVGSGLESLDVASLHRDQLQKLQQFKVSSGLVASIERRVIAVHSQEAVKKGVPKLHGLHCRINTKIANEKYLRSHKEVELLLSGFLREVLLQRPENIREFAADYFTNPELPRKIQQEMMEHLNQAL